MFIDEKIEFWFILISSEWLLNVTWFLLKILLRILMRILMRILSVFILILQLKIITTISDCKIKAKINKALTKTLSKTHEIFNNKSHMTFSHLSDKITMSQNPVFSPANIIITKKTIFVLNAVFQIIQLEAVNLLLTLIKHL